MRRSEWVKAGVFDRLVDEALSAYDKAVGLDLSEVAVDGSLHKAPSGGEGTGKSPVDRGKLGWKWSIATDRLGIPIGWVTAGANCNDCVMLPGTLASVALRGLLADVETLHLDRGYDNEVVRATWVDDDERIVWLCAVRRREDGSDDDAFEWFKGLHRDGRLLPTNDDRLRDQAEEAIRSYRRLREAVIELVDGARDDPGGEHDTDLDGWLPARAIVYRGDGIEEIWCAIGVSAVDGNFIRHEMRDLLFAALEEHLTPMEFEARNDWPTGEVGWYEAVRLGLR